MLIAFISIYIAFSDIGTIPLAVWSVAFNVPTGICLVALFMLKLPPFRLRRYDTCVKFAFLGIGLAALAVFLLDESLADFEAVIMILIYVVYQAFNWGPEALKCVRGRGADYDSDIAMDEVRTNERQAART